MRRTIKQQATAVVIALVGSAGIAACSSASGGTPNLTWYINPDGGGSDPTKGGQAQLAKECTAASNGKYTITIQQLPNSASDQRIQLLRRLAAGDASMDLMSMDPVFVAEFAEAGYLAPVPQSMQAEFTQDRVQSAIDASKWQGKLVAVPFWANTQLLWYRKSVAAKAGLDMSKPVTWDQLIAAAQKTNTKIGVQASLYEGYMVWINALISGAGGKIVENPGARYTDLKLGLDSQAGRDAAKIIQQVASTGVGGPAMGSSTETEALNLFQNTTTSGFLVNWPYTYAALTSAKVPFLNDIGWTMYPQTVAGETSRPPFGGIELGVGAKSAHPDLAYQAAACISNEKNQTTYMLGTGNPASRKAVFEEANVKKAFPMANLIQESLQQAAPRPQSQYYGDISSGIQQQFSPPSSVNQQTPAKAQDFILKVLNGKALL
ncbi:carbohydrate ABC transporter substrate-binding protein (CUT1 family) [Branchiibius hedensis]|uniref:Carbohydrate ABC transporter substrate-binding protein, CUT1 family n=1 Tax=Branchiibius hedensis TaxID=672460 RepID=A0A2Y9BSX0_9MICO|nr:extracellular solute-binding protein [Branchiibius hedensis]PWJ24235.1 carbohydrate ABC transporter substrate-binding protein (CUT1 family) [Branchiibius hedensis]SSA33052.1 carbohydrate ABC transporter substrate-binding protein, CUT1 family [Branchiibius hedensis]